MSLKEELAYLVGIRELSVGVDLKRVNYKIAVLQNDIAVAEGRAVVASATIMELAGWKAHLSLHDYLAEEFKLLGVVPHITHLKQPDGCFYNFVTVATPQYKLYPYLAAVLSEVYSEGSRTHKTGSDLDRLLVRKFAELGYGVSPCHARDNFSRKRGRIISEGRMLKALRNGHCEI